jgi:hypothetical protein
MQITPTVPDLRGEPHRIHLAASGAPTLDVTVQFAEEASKVFSAYREKYEFGASEMKARCGNIYDSHNRLVGRISYNGLIWDTNGNPVQSAPDPRPSP